MKPQSLFGKVAFWGFLLSDIQMSDIQLSVVQNEKRAGSLTLGSLS